MQLQQTVTENELLKAMPVDMDRRSHEPLSDGVPMQHTPTDFYTKRLVPQGETPDFTELCSQTFWSMQPEDLWRRAFAKLPSDFQSSEYFILMWYEVYLSCVTSPRNDGDIAHRAAVSFEENLVKARKNLSRADQRIYAMDLENSLDRLSQILSVVKDTLDFTTGGFIWTCVCQIASVSMSMIYFATPN